MNRKSKKCTLAVTASLAVAASAFGSHYVSNRKTSDTEPTVKRESVRTLTQRTGSLPAEAESMMSMRPETGLPGSPADPRHRLPAQGIMKLPEHNEDGVRIYYVVAQFWDNDNHDEKGAYYLDVDTDKTPHCYKVFDSSVFGPYISRGCTAVEDSFYALYQTSNSSPWWDYYVRYDINTWEYNDFWNDNVQISAFDICYDPWTDQTFGYSSYNYGKSTYSLASIDFEKKKKREIGPEIPYGERIIALAADMDYLYGFDNNADLYRIDKTTGEKVLVGSTGLSMASRWESAVIDMRTRRLFLSATRYDRDAGKNYSCIWEINKETAAPTLIMDHGFDQQDIGLWSEELSTMSCPAVPENLSVEVEAGELSGNISFTAPLTLRDGSATSGSLTYEVIMNGRSVATGSTSCGEDGPEELYNNTGYKFEGDRRRRIEEFFHRNRLGFATSKINNNYTDYLDVVSLFAQKKVCSIIGLPFYYSDSLKAVMVAYIEMKDNWHSPTNRYLLDESDYAVFEFLMRQLLSSIDMLEANEKIKQMNDKLNHLAVTDKLTGLYNREGFYGNISGMLKGNEEIGLGQAIIIMYIDLDNFKYYNDTFGHGVGDIILTGMAGIFREEAGENGFVTRYGGDEFLITIYTDDRTYVEQLAKNIYSRIEREDGFSTAIRHKLGKNIDIPKEHRISCSIGISGRRALTSEEELEKMVKEADQVLYDVKNAGKGVYKFYALN